MHSFLKDIDWQERVNQLSSNKVVLYGAGKYGINVLENIKKYLPQLDVLCFVDDDKLRHGENVAGLKVVSLDEVVEQYKDCNILITNYYILQVLKKIQQSSFDISNVFWWGELMIEDIDNEFLRKNKNNLQKSYDSLEDGLSKMLFKNMIESRFSKNIEFFGRTCEKQQYFPEEIIKLNNNEVFVDVGAYDGDTIEMFLSIVSGKYKHIYAFEPDKRNYDNMRYLGGGRNISLYNSGLYCESKLVNFSANKGGSSKIEENGLRTIKVEKFDELDSIEDEVTFVKMDIEGSELMALHGMEETIKRSKPKLAVCIYHKFEDIWEIPLYIKSLVPEYRLYIRNYTTYLDEIVLYAVI